MTWVSFTSTPGLITRNPSSFSPGSTFELVEKHANCAPKRLDRGPSRERVRAPLHLFAVHQNEQRIGLPARNALFLFSGM